MSEHAGHLIQIADAHVCFSRRLLDDAHRMNDRRASGAEDGDGFVDALDERHDVLHRASNGAAAGSLFGCCTFQMLCCIAHRCRLLTDFARSLRLLLRRRGSRACDLGNGVGRTLGQLENFSEHGFRARRQPHAVADAIGADRHLLRCAFDGALHVADQRTNFIGGN